MPILLNLHKDNNKALQIFPENDNDQEPIDNLIKINHEFAKKFEERKRREELQQLSEKYEKGGFLSDDDDVGYTDEYSDPSSSSSSESEDEDPLKSLSTDVNLIKTLAKIRAKDASIYDSNTMFFPAEETPQKDKTEKKNEDPLTLQKYKYNMLVSGSFLNDDDDDDDGKKKPPLTYTQEQDELRSAVIRAASAKGGDNDEDEEELFSKVKKMEKTNDDLYKEAMLEAISKEKHVQETMKAWIPSKTSPRADKKETVSIEHDDEATDAFLAKYILNRGWSYSKKKESKLAKTASKLDSDVEELERAEEFENAFNFRFENNLYPITSSTASTGSSVRQCNETRKNARKARLERKKAKKMIEDEELKRLKALKRMEIEEKAKKIALLSGHNKDPAIENLLEELEGSSSFDEAEHDARMASLFNDDYYDAVEPSEKKLKTKDEKNTKAREEKSRKTEHEDVQELEKELVKLEDEYFNLHYEDKIAGGLATRFKYTSVIPSSFGLRTKDILANDDKTLNKYISLKKLRPYRDEEEQARDAKRYSKKRAYKRLYFLAKK